MGRKVIVNDRGEIALGPDVRTRRNGSRRADRSQERRSGFEVVPLPTLPLKRSLDVALATLALAILWPVWLLAVLLIKMDSPGKAVLSQKRVGQGGKLFDFYKFRTMVNGAENGGHDYGRVPKGDLGETLLSPPGRDPRVTRIGSVLRKTTVDELPQLLNVIKGDMSLVGPRPDIPEIVASWPPSSLERHRVKPGMTGLAQVNGRSDLTHLEKLRYDLQYVRRHPITRDLAILLKTIALVISTKGAR
jgi:lipopolysaccharide/colanic/teichoic acid biosynthesis glycosyltransferase